MIIVDPLWLIVGGAALLYIGIVLGQYINQVQTAAEVTKLLRKLHNLEKALTEEIMAPKDSHVR